MPRHHPRPASASSLAFGIQGTGPASSLAFGAALPRVGNEWSTSSCVKPLGASRNGRIMGGIGGGGGGSGGGGGGGGAGGSGGLRWQPPRPVKRLPGGRTTSTCSSTSALLGPHVRKQSRRYMVQGAGCSTSALLGPYVHKQIQPGSTAPMATHGQLTLLPTPSDESLDRHSNSVSGHPSALVWSVPELLVEARGEGGGGGRDGDGPWDRGQGAGGRGQGAGDRRWRDEDHHARRTPLHSPPGMVPSYLSAVSTYLAGPITLYQPRGGEQRQAR